MGSRNDRFLTTNEITSPSSLRPHEYGSFVARFQPLLRAWYLELQGLKADWKDCLYKLEGQETNAEIYIPLFLTFVFRGVASLVYKYTKDMD